MTPRAALLAAVTVSSVLLQALIPLNWDLAWLGYVAREANSGVRLYQDIIEINPPLIVWLLRPVAYTAGVLCIALEHALRAWSWLAVIIPGWIAVRVMAPSYDAPAVVPVAFALLVLPGVDFGQREHLAMAWMLPWLAISVGRLHGRSPGGIVAATLGILAGLGLALKPHLFLVVPAMVAVQWRSGSAEESGNPLRYTEHVALCAAAAVYAASVLILEPQYLHLVTRIGEEYSSWNRGRSDRWLSSNVLGPAGPLLGYLALRMRGKPLAEHHLLAAAVVALWIAGAVQGKAFPYHFFPAIATATLLGVGLLPFTTPRWLSIPLAATVLIPAIDQNSLRASDARARVTLMSTALATVPPGGSVLILSQTVSHPWPAVLLNRWQWASSFPSSWWTAEIFVRNGRAWWGKGRIDIADLSPGEDWILRRAVRDLAARRPDAIVTFEEQLARPGSAYTPDQIELLRADGEGRRLLAPFISRPAPAGWRLLVRDSREPAGPAVDEAEP